MRNKVVCDGCATMVAIQRDATGTRAASGKAAFSPADRLSLAAAPTFAVMAVLTGMLGGGVPDVLCAGAPDALPLNGMSMMYLLMTAFHAAPWLKLISGRRSAARGS